jgi:hypothetical protein
LCPRCVVGLAIHPLGTFGRLVDNKICCSAIVRISHANNGETRTWVGENLSWEEEDDKAHDETRKSHLGELRVYVRGYDLEVKVDGGSGGTNDRHVVARIVVSGGVHALRSQDRQGTSFAKGVWATQLIVGAASSAASETGKGEES